jgi:hypothetical protein
MKKMTMALVIAMAAVALALTGAEHADQSTDKAKPAGTTGQAPAAAPAKGPRIAVEPESFDFGRALQHKTLTKEFVLHNFGSEDLVIDRIDTTCGCTVAELEDKTIEPGESTPLRVNLETKASVGKIERTVIIQSNDPAKKSYSFKVQAEVVAETGTGAAKTGVR